jgi:hypothetical protein
VRVTCTCGATWDGYRIQHCTVPGCHQTFTGTYTGDMHRVGVIGVKEGPNRRRCLSPDEMRAKGLVQNDEGQWYRGGMAPPPWAIERRKDE